MADLLELTDDSFHSEVIESGEPVLVDFWAPWCGPCKMLTPVIEEVAADYAGRVKVAKVNTDDQRQAASTYGVTALPTLLIFKGGEVVKTMRGFHQKEQLVAALDEQLA